MLHMYLFISCILFLVYKQGFSPKKNGMKGNGLLYFAIP